MSRPVNNIGWVTQYYSWTAIPWLLPQSLLRLCVREVLRVLVLWEINNFHLLLESVPLPNMTRAFTPLLKIGWKWVKMDENRSIKKRAW